ncbi:MAG: Crp/Fnr family transcriptional regulator [Pseudomonadales bacterium]|jgi:CRP-like cAMP-binding protein|nr:Crp/Fnr family transcriptional regulator [Pseudomonadales bacterium]
MDVTPELLSFFPLLQPLPLEVRAVLAQVASFEKHARRSVVLSAGVEANRLCLLFDGRLQAVNFTVDGREVGLYFVDRGDFCGELGLFDYGPQPEYLIALAPSTLVSIPLDEFRAHAMGNGAIVTALGQRLAQRLRQMSQQRALLGMPSIPQRVCCQLWSLVPPGERDAAQGAIRNPPTHMEIAIMLNLSRESVARVFQALQTQDLLRRAGMQELEITDLAKLKALAEGTLEL